MFSFTDKCLKNLVIMILLEDVEHILGHWQSDNCDDPCKKNQAGGTSTN